MSKVIKSFEALKQDVKPLNWNTYWFIDSTVEKPIHKSWISIYFIVNKTPQPESIIQVMAKFSSESKLALEYKTPRQITLRINDFPLFREE